jgi:hypothetical protein
MSANQQSVNSREPVAAGENTGDWVHLDDLPTAPELAEAIDAYCAHYGYRGEERRRVEEQFKLAFYYGGKTVGYLRTPRGIAVCTAVATVEEYAAVKSRLSSQQRKEIMLYTASPWNEASLPTCWETGN